MQTTMKTCALLSMDNLDVFEVYDHLLFEPLKEVGWHAEKVSWRSNNVNWDSYDSVIIRSPWVYQMDPQTFLDVLTEIVQLWVNPDCGLKTRGWEGTESSLKNMVRAAHKMREKYTSHDTKTSSMTDQ